MNDPTSECTGKAGYCKQQADVVARRMRARKGGGSRCVRSYKCMNCAKYHVGGAMPKLKAKTKPVLRETLGY